MANTAESNETTIQQTPLAADISFPLIAFAVFLLSFAVLVFEVALTRLFSVVLRYHFVFLVTSVAVCGLGLGGLVFHQIRARWRDAIEAGARLRIFLFLTLCGFALATPAVILIILLWLLPNFPTFYMGVAILMVIPFLFAGVFLSCAFERFAERSGQLYAADLIGAALAAGAVILLLKVLGAIDTCFAAAMVAVVCALGLVGGGAGRPRRGCNQWILVGVVMLIVNAAILLVNRSTRFADIPPMKITDQEEAAEISKPLFHELADPKIGARIVRTDWSAFARTDVVEEKDNPDAKYIWTDGEVPTQMVKFDGDLKKVEYFKGFIGFLPYHTERVRRTLCIGPGGGLDVLLGLLAGVPEIDGVEINSSIPDIVRKYADFNGHLYERPNVHITVGDGRTYVRHSPHQYDLIYLALTQTATSGNVGLALVESYIHTTNALQDYLKHLSSNGRLALITQEYTILCRCFASAVQVFIEQGESPAQACNHIALFSVPPQQFAGNPYRRLFLVQKSPYTPEQARQLYTFARRMRLQVLFIPGVYPGTPFGRVASGELDLTGFVNLFREYEHINIQSVTDDSPFFIDLTLSAPPVLTRLGIGALVLCALFSLWAAFTMPRYDAGAAHWPRALPFVLYYTALGVGFMLVEIALTQKMILFLGYPTLALSVILSSLLLGGGGGSWFSQRFSGRRLHRVIIFGAAGVFVLVLMEAMVIQVLFTRCNLPSIALRSIVGVVLLLPLGFFLGIPFPTGLRMLSDISVSSVPWMWGVNGVTSVVGSILAAIGAKLWGFNHVLMLGSCIYAAIAICFTTSHAMRPRDVEQ